MRLFGKLLNKARCTTANKGSVRSEHHAFCYRCSAGKWRWQPAITQEGGGAEAWGGGQRCAPERKQPTFSFFFLDGFHRLGETLIQKFV